AAALVRSARSANLIQKSAVFSSDSVVMACSVNLSSAVAATGSSGSAIAGTAPATMVAASPTAAVAATASRLAADTGGVRTVPPVDGPGVVHQAPRRRPR